MLAVRKPADGGPAVLLLAPDSVCSCEQGLECSHMYCLLLVLYCMQDCSSWDDFSSKVLFYDLALEKTLGEKFYITLDPGDRYDLKTRRELPAK